MTASSSERRGLVMGDIDTRPAPQQRVWIAEFPSMRVEAIAPFAQLPSIVRQVFDISAGPGVSKPMSANTRYVRIITEVECAMSTEGVTVAGIILPRFHVEYFGVTPGMVITVSPI